MTRFYLTGRLVIEGREVVDQSRLPGRQGRLALVALTLWRHRPVPAPELADALWGDDVPASVDTSLRAVVSRVRGAVAAADPDATITADAGCYQLRAPGAWVDVEAAGNALDRAEGALRSGDVREAWPHGSVASAIARRPLLPGEDAAWVVEARGRLHAIQVRALVVLAAVARERGDRALAVAFARDLVRLDPFREDGHRQLMQAHVAAGDGAEAVRAYEACRRLLRDELGIDPSPETRRLYEQVLDGTRQA